MATRPDPRVAFLPPRTPLKEGEIGGYVAEWGEDRQLLVYGLGKHALQLQFGCDLTSRDHDDARNGRLLNGVPISIRRFHGPVPLARDPESQGDFRPLAESEPAAIVESHDMLATISDGLKEHAAQLRAEGNPEAAVAYLSYLVMASAIDTATVQFAPTAQTHHLVAPAPIQRQPARKFFDCCFAARRQSERDGR